MAIVKANKLTKTFGKGRTAVKAVQAVSLTVKPGEIVLIMGPSGSGKTTLLSMIGTLLKSDSGKLEINGSNISDIGSKSTQQLRINSVGFIFQQFNLLSSLTALQNVMVPMMAAGASRKVAKAKSTQLLTDVGLKERLQHLPKDLSGGEQQRVAIARSLANDPELILADEPTANLDSKTGNQISLMLCEIVCKQHKGLIIVSHDERLKSIAKRVVTIEDGKLVHEAPGEHEKSCPAEHRTT